ncbi:hypothetical protein JHK87_026761 [Glycine soja]|nr:hypothetical protein JHK87_026761 [Glycine soja]
MPLCMSMTGGSFPAVNSVSTNVPFASAERAKMWLVKPSSGPSFAPVQSPSYQVPIATPRPQLPHYHHRHHCGKPYAAAPSLSKDQACSQICTDPLTATPFGSPCGCVFPMKVRLVLDAAPLAVFPVIDELEIELSSGTYLKQSQVRIMGVTADSQNQGKTTIDIYLVPLGEKFDNTTAVLLSKRFWHNEVPLNRSLFGDYAILCITYPGIPSPRPPETLTGRGHMPRESINVLPITADMNSENEKMNLRTIIVIALSSVVLLLVLVGAFYIILKWRKIRRPSSAVGPAFTSCLNKRSGMEFMLSRRIMSSRSMSLASALAHSILSVKTFSFSELEKATTKFSSQRVLGEGGFGRVYCGTLDDGNEVAVKLLTRDGQNGDREFVAEVEMLSRLHHRNLVKLIGICIEGPRRCLVYELFRNGSVESHLHGDDKKRSPLNWEARTKIALGSARGLAYLHEDSTPPVIHRDFKASNVLLEDDFTPKGQENLVTWARPLLRSREGLEQLVDPSLAGSYDFDDMAKMAGIAFMCVHPEVNQRPFMGEVVQALKLIHNDTNESNKESSAWASDFGGELVFSDSSWLDAEELAPRLAYGQASTLITMDFNSDHLEMMENRPFSASSLNGDEISLPIRHRVRSGPLRIAKSKLPFTKLTRSQSERVVHPSKRVWNDDGYWV